MGYGRTVLLGGTATLMLLILFVVLSPRSELQPQCCCSSVGRLVLQEPPVVAADVVDLKTALARIGFYRSQIDPVYDAQAAAAICKVQYALGLAATGIADDQTWRALAYAQLKPVAGTKEPAGDVSLLVDIETNTLVVYEGRVPFALYPVAVGKPQSPTPIGEWIITEKTAGWQGAIGIRWMRLSTPWGSYGIHGTNNPGSIGHQASAGCVRMLNEDVRQVYDWVKLGTPVLLKGRPLEVIESQSLHPGMIGQDVVYLQWRLKEQGYDLGRADGVFGEATRRAVVRWKMVRGLRPTGVVDSGLLCLLGLR